MLTGHTPEDCGGKDQSCNVNMALLSNGLVVALFILAR